MTQLLFARAQRAMDESAALREQCRMIQERSAHQRGELRRAIVESARLRVELSARRQNTKD
jgi:hypothetical protein